MVILDAIYGGEFRPSETGLMDCADFKRASQEICRIRSVLEQHLSEGDFALVEQLLNQTLLARDAESTRLFQYGFSAGLLLMKEAETLVSKQISS